MRIYQTTGIRNILFTLIEAVNNLKEINVVEYKISIEFNLLQRICC